MREGRNKPQSEGEGQEGSREAEAREGSRVQESDDEDESGDGLECPAPARWKVGGSLLDDTTIQCVSSSSRYIHPA